MILPLVDGGGDVRTVVRKTRSESAADSIVKVASEGAVKAESTGTGTGTGTGRARSDSMSSQTSSATTTSATSSQVVPDLLDEIEEEEEDITPNAERRMMKKLSRIHK